MKLKEKIANAKAYVQNNQKKFILMMCSIVIVGGMVAGTLAWLAARTGPVINNFIGSNLEIDLLEESGTVVSDPTSYVSNPDPNAEYRVFEPMTPGTFIKKDAKVTVKAGSEACWLFLQVKESKTQANGSGLTVNIGETETTRKYEYLIRRNSTSTYNPNFIADGWSVLANSQSIGFVQEDDEYVYSYYYRQVSSIAEGELTEDEPFSILHNDQIYVNEYLVNQELDLAFLKEHPVTISFRPAAVQLLGFEDQPLRAAEEISVFKSAS